MATTSWRQTRSSSTSRRRRAYLSPYEGELRDAVRKEGSGRGWTATRFNVFVVGWNTNLVKPGQEPKTFEELADPKWKGKVSMEIGDVDWFTALYQHFLKQGKSEQEVTDLFKRIAANSKIAKGHTVQGELLSAGQFPVAISSYSHTIDKAARRVPRWRGSLPRRAGAAGGRATERHRSDEDREQPVRRDAVRGLRADRRPEGLRGELPRRGHAGGGQGHPGPRRRRRARAGAARQPQEVGRPVRRGHPKSGSQ